MCNKISEQILLSDPTMIYVIPIYFLNDVKKMKASQVGFKPKYLHNQSDPPPIQLLGGIEVIGTTFTSNIQRAS